MEICKIKDCEEKHEAKGYCNKHYQRFKKYGDPLHTKMEMHGMTETPEYQTWANMKDRCYNKKCKDYRYYGDRDISVCDKWTNSFLAFLKDMGLKPFSKAQIDRIDNDGNYTPRNCRWTTAAENSRNRSNNKLIMAQAIKIRILYETGKHFQRKLAEKYNVSRRLIRFIINNKQWRIEK